MATSRYAKELEERRSELVSDLLSAGFGIEESSPFHDDAKEYALSHLKYNSFLEPELQDVARRVGGVAEKLLMQGRQGSAKRLAHLGGKVLGYTIDPGGLCERGPFPCDAPVTNAVSLLLMLSGSVDPGEALESGLYAAALETDEAPESDKDMQPAVYASDSNDSDLDDWERDIDDYFSDDDRKAWVFPEGTDYSSPFPSRQLLSPIRSRLLPRRRQLLPPRGRRRPLPVVPSPPATSVQGPTEAWEDALLGAGFGSECVLQEISSWITTPRWAPAFEGRIRRPCDLLEHWLRTTSDSMGRPQRQPMSRIWNVKLVPEAEVVSAVLNMLQGIESPYFSANLSSGVEVRVGEHAALTHLSPPCLYSILASVAEDGSRLMRVRSFCDDVNTSSLPNAEILSGRALPKYGACHCAFAEAMVDILTPLEEWLAKLDRDLYLHQREVEPRSFGAAQCLTLLGFTSAWRPWSSAVLCLHDLIDKGAGWWRRPLEQWPAARASATQLLDALYDEVQGETLLCSDDAASVPSLPSLGRALWPSYLLVASTTPYLRMLNAWISEGVIRDPIRELYFRGPPQESVGGPTAGRHQRDGKFVQVAKTGIFVDGECIPKLLGPLAYSVVLAGHDTLLSVHIQAMQRRDVGPDRITNRVTPPCLEECIRLALTPRVILKDLSRPIPPHHFAEPVTENKSHVQLSLATAEEEPLDPFALDGRALHPLLCHHFLPEATAADEGPLQDHPLRDGMDHPADRCANESERGGPLELQLSRFLWRSLGSYCDEVGKRCVKSMLEEVRVLDVVRCLRATFLGASPLLLQHYCTFIFGALDDCARHLQRGMGLQGLSALGSSFLLADGVQLTWALRSSLGSASLIDASHSTLSQPLLGGSSAFATLFSVQPPSSLEATEANSVPGAVLLDVLEHIQMQCALPRPYDDIITPDVMHKYAIAHSLIMQCKYAIHTLAAAHTENKWRGQEPLSVQDAAHRHLLCTQQFSIFHLVRSVHDYLLMQAVVGRWSMFEERALAASSLRDFVCQHDTYVDALVDDCFLHPRHQSTLSYLQGMLRQATSYALRQVQYAEEVAQATAGDIPSRSKANQSLSQLEHLYGEFQRSSRFFIALLEQAVISGSNPSGAGLLMSINCDFYRRASSPAVVEGHAETGLTPS